MGRAVSLRGDGFDRPLVLLEACVGPVLHLVLPLPAYVQPVQPDAASTLAVATTTLASAA